MRVPAPVLSAESPDDTLANMRLVAFALCALVVVGCRKDETLGAYGAADHIWVLQELDGVVFAERATLRIPEPGQITGDAPCNTYSGKMSAPYPWFETGPLAITRMACPDLAAETRFFAALETMTLSEVSGDTLILSNETGREMVFKDSD